MSEPTPPSQMLSRSPLPIFNIINFIMETNEVQTIPIKRRLTLAEKIKIARMSKLGSAEIKRKTFEKNMNVAISKFNFPDKLGFLNQHN